MKHFFNGMMIGLALVMALVVGVTAMAESTEANAPELPPVEEAQSEQDAQQSAADDNTALREAFDAYRAARQSSRQEAMESELEDFVASGKLTQEQADLILNYYKERDSLRNGTCPDCGYEFQNGFGKGNRGMGNRGMGNRGMGGRGTKGGRMFGGMNMPGTQSGTQSGAEPQASGMDYGFDVQTLPYMSDSEGI